MKNISSGILIKPILALSILAGILVFTFPRHANAQPQNIRFKRLTSNDGLSNSWIHTILQDKYGFMWIGTDDGLNRYDGNDFRVYKNNFRDKYSISSSNVMSMIEDSRGALWIGTRQGLNLYDRKNDRFIQYPKLLQQPILSITEDNDRNLWLGGNFSLFCLNLKNDSIKIYTVGANTSIFIDSKKNMWVGSVIGLFLYNKDGDTLIHYTHDNKDPNSLISNNVRSILGDKSGKLWIGTGSGLDLFMNAKDRPSKGIFVHYRNNVNDKNSISAGAILSLLEDDKQNLWIGIENGGLDLLNLNTYKEGVNRFVHFKNDPNRGTSLSHNSIYSLFQDKQGSIWIGTFGNGIDLVNPILDKFTHVISEPGVKNSLGNNAVNAFFEENDFLWIGTGGGLDRYNKRDDTFKHFVYDPLNKKSIGSNAIWALCKDKRGNLWIGTWGGGLNRFDYKTETFEQYFNNPKDTTSIGSNNMFSVFEDSKGNLWIGTMGGGLNMFESKKKIFTRYHVSNSGIYTNYVQAIIETKNGDLWFANGSAFSHLDITTNTIENFLHSANDSTSLSSNKVMSIFEDSKGNIWMGTDAGLNLFNKSTKGFTCYRIENGLPDNSINSILEDKHGNLWIGTNKGLSKFINAVNLPAKPKFKNYTYGDGLQGNDFGKRSCLRGADGTMYFGGSNGFNVFDPDKITENAYVPPVVITEFQIFNKPVPIGERGLKNDVDSTEDLVLSYKQSVLSLDFAALNYISSSNNQYAYKMEGFDNAWNYVGIKHSATYTNLDPGKYIFRVKGSNNDGVWNEKGIALPIIITPPYWETIWFRLFLVAIAAGIAFWIYHWRMQARDLEARKRMETAVTKERNLLRALIDLIPDYIYLKDTDSRFILGNNGLLRSFGKETIDEIYGKTDFDFHPLENAREYFVDEQEIIRSGQPLINKEELVVEFSGQRKWSISTKLPFLDSQGKVVGIVGIGRDVTASKQAEEERERLIRELQDAAADIKVLSGLVPICSSCKKIRDDKGYWTQLEGYIQAHSEAKFSHGVCPECAQKLYGDLYAKVKKQQEAASTKLPSSDLSKG